MWYISVFTNIFVTPTWCLERSIGMPSLWNFFYCPSRGKLWQVLTQMCFGNTCNTAIFNNFQCAKQWVRKYCQGGCRQSLHIYECYDGVLDLRSFITDSYGWIVLRVHLREWHHWFSADGIYLTLTFRFLLCYLYFVVSPQMALGSVYK